MSERFEPIHSILRGKIRVHEHGIESGRAIPQHSRKKTTSQVWWGWKIGRRAKVEISLASAMQRTLFYQIRI